MFVEISDLKITVKSYGWTSIVNRKLKMSIASTAETMM